MHSLREERKEAQADAAENQAEIDALSEDIDKLLAAFNTLQEARDSAEAARNAAERSRDVARLEQANTEQKIAELEDEIAKTEESLAESAVSAFRSHQGPNSEQTALGSNPWRDARAEALRRFANLSTEDLLDEFRGQAAELEALREAATQKTVELEALHDKAQQTLETFNNALAVEDEAIEALNSRLDHRLAEAQYLEDLDAELAAKIRAEEQRIADAIAAATAAAAKRKPQIVTVPNNALVDQDDLTSVWSITVNVKISEQLRGFLATMEEEGFTLGGSGYRDNARQIQLRRQHCGNSDHAVYQMPASQCSPPTARPGLSQHESGLAIDFTYNGRIISSRDTDVFKVMNRIAPDYGFENLPSEPWHWSSTGQ